MDSDPLPDHYKALGVEKTADASTIKATYRKLVLKCHPDKVTDPALKEQKQEEFHKIQQAYEVLSDEEKRSRYEADLKLERLRKEKLAKGSVPREKTARFDVRTTGGATFAATGPPRYATETRMPSSMPSMPRDDDRYFDERPYAKYETYPPKPSATSRSSREKEPPSRSTRYATSDRTRSEREKTRAKEGRSERKFVSVESESSSDEKARYEADYKRRSADDEARKEAMRKSEDRRSYEDTRYAAPTHRKMSAQAEEALRYQHKSRIQVEDELGRPSPVRTSSRDYYQPESRSARREVRPEPVRRSSARPGKDRPSLSRRDTDRTERGIPEVVEWADERRTEERRPPTFKHTSSSPAELAREARERPQRSYTDAHQRHAGNSPPPAFHRSATMPSAAHSSSRRKDSTVPRPSGLREAMTPPDHHGSPEHDAFTTIPPPQTPSGSKTTYYYPSSGGGVQVRPENVAPARGHPVIRESGRYQRSPSPIGKPPIGANRPTEPVPQYKTVRPSMPGRTESTRNLSPIRSSEDRGRSGRPKLYGEVSSDSRRSGRQPSYSPSDVQFSRQYGPEDIRWAPKAGENVRGYASKPALGRSATSVY
ncbi:DnaJ-domain-containing protein [Decorospora gaudefroyi]|uniref:DnaJ-domain-containing protein n=1 Tax=Decorospora gaudefroyi TaxID=184978 RepID=A0A6A5KFT5_9PLEO|nr:DnaJ-domain-containing protein [Decorospora gaudefroyi]